MPENKRREQASTGGAVAQSQSESESESESQSGLESYEYNGVPEDERWSGEAIKGMKGTPQQPEA